MQSWRAVSSKVSAVVVAVAVAGCTGSSSTSAPGPVEALIDAAADDAGVSRDLVLAIAVEEGGLQLPAYRIVAADDDDNVPIAGLLELRHGRLDTLALGARLVGATEADLRTDTALATRAGAQVLASLGRQTAATEDLASWRRALELLSGLDDAGAHAYASRVLGHLRTGGTFPARAGERVTLAPHPEIDAALTVALVVPAGTPEFPGAIWITTSCTDKCDVGRPLGRASVDKIVIHDTEGGWNASVATLQNDPGKSVHYLIDADGSRVGQFRPENDTTWHAGNYFYNETSIGIEHVGVAADPAGYSAALYAKSQDLVRSIRTRWDVPLDRTHIIGHYQIPDGTQIAQSSPPCTDPLDKCETSANYGGAANHRDPGYHWQWCQYMQGLGGSCTCNDAWSLWNCTTDKTEAVRCVDGNVEIASCVNGCDVQPSGVDDICHTDEGSGSGSDGGTTPAQTEPARVDGGCAASSGGNGALAMMAAMGALVIARRPRRRR